MNRLLILAAIIALATPLAAGQMPYKMSVEAARTVIEELASHDFAKVAARFDDRMRAALKVERGREEERTQARLELAAAKQALAERTEQR